VWGQHCAAADRGKTLTITPPWRFIVGTAAWQQNCVLKELTSNGNRVSVSVVPGARPRSTGVMAPPALLTRMSSLPK
jgi:hypothetical protein